jgi:lysophospholipase L1-like esterase
MSSSRRFSVAILGHSYIRRLQEYTSSRPQCCNLDIPQGYASINWVCAGGACVRHGMHYRSAYHLLPELGRLAPDVVFVHLGENDLRAMSSSALVSDILDFVGAVIDECHPRIVIISQLTLFLHNDDLSERVKFVNRELERHCTSSQHGTQLIYWRHRIGIWGPDRQQLYSRDGVHLNSYGMRKYCHSVHRVVVRALNTLDASRSNY